MLKKTPIKNEHHIPNHNWKTPKMCPKFILNFFVVNKFLFLFEKKWLFLKFKINKIQQNTYFKHTGCQAR